MNPKRIEPIVVEMEDWRINHLPEIYKQHLELLLNQRIACIKKIRTGQQKDISKLDPMSIEKRINKRVRTLFKNSDNVELSMIIGGLSQIFSNFIKEPEVYQQSLSILSTGLGRPLELQLASHTCLLLAGFFYEPQASEQKKEFEKYTRCASRYSWIILKNKPEVRGQSTRSLRQWLTDINNTRRAAEIFSELLNKSSFI